MTHPAKKLSSLSWLASDPVKEKGWSFLSFYLSDNDSLFNFSEFECSTKRDLHKVLDACLQNNKQVFKNSQVTSVVQVQLKSCDCIIKRYNARSLLHHLKRSIRVSRASRCWNMSYAFSAAGINVATPYLMHERRIGPFRLGAYFVSEKLRGEELKTALPKMTTAQKKQVLALIANVFEKMREAKITHGDMKASNIMWVNEQLYFIDLDASKIHVTHASWQHSHSKDVKRFLKNWKDQPELLALFSELAQ